MVPLTEGVLRSQTPPIDTTVNMWRTMALEKSSGPSEASSVAEEPQVERVQTASWASHPLTQSQTSRSFVPSSASDSLTKTLSSGTLSASARTILEIGSSTGTDVVASTLSFRGTASASLLGDSCGPGSSFETSSSTYDGRRYRQQTVPPAQTQSQGGSASASVYRAEVDEPRSTDSKSHEVSQAPPNAPQDLPQDRGASAPHDELLDSLEGQVSDSDDYVTATSPSTSFVSLSGMSAFPDDDEVDEQPSNEPFLQDPALDIVEPSPEAPPTPAAFSEMEVQTIRPEDDASTVTPIEDETVRDDRSKDSDVSTPVVAARDLSEPEAPVAEVPQPVPAPRHVDACTQADVVESPVKHDTPLPTQIPLPQPADTVYSPAAESVRITPLPSFETLQPEEVTEVPGSPQSDVLSALSLVVPSLAKLPSVVDAAMDEQSIGSVLASPDMIVQTPIPSVALDALSPSVLQATPQMSIPSPSVVESSWPSESDDTYDSSVLNASPSLRSEARTFTEYAGVAESPTISDAQIASMLLKTPTKLATVIHEEDAVSMTMGLSEMDSETSSTPTASSWVSSLPPSVPSNTLNEENGSIALDIAPASYAASVHKETSIFEPSMLDHEVAAPKAFVEEGCQVDFIAQKFPVRLLFFREFLVLIDTRFPDFPTNGTITDLAATVTSISVCWRNAGNC